MDNRYSGSQLKLVTDTAHDRLESSEWKEIRRDRLINTLNRINFQDGEVVLNFRHTKYNAQLSIAVCPQPCSDKRLVCDWLDSLVPEKKLKSYVFDHFYFSDGFKKILVHAELTDISSQWVKLDLPETCYEIKSRKIRRHKCWNVSAQLSQEGVVIEGELKSYSAVSFSVKVPLKYRNAIQGIDQGSSLSIILKNDTDFVYSGSCEIFRSSREPGGFIFVLRPIKSQIQRFKAKKHRSIRQKLVPMPSIIFKHPLIDKKINLKASDISGSGFSVEEDLANSTLIPGLIIPELNIELMNKGELTCMAQIVYRTADDTGKTRCGFAFLDMGLRDQVSLSSLLHQAKNKNSYVSTKIDVDELWSFFFDTDFIYPEKYTHISQNKNEFKELYKRLYESNLDFAINFIYKDKGSIFAHMSMFRFYERTWLINHHAARSSKNSKAGLVVLEQISRYINESYQFRSTYMDCVACYFRPENKFPNLVFGGVTKSATDTKKCSIDQFAYMQINKKYLQGRLAKHWSLAEASIEDIKALEFFYENESGGLTLQAMDLGPETFQNNQLNDLYFEHGFKRDRIIFSLKFKDELIAVFVVNISNIGMNLSDLTSCIHTFILEQNHLPNDVLYSALTEICAIYEHDNIPILIYPSSYSDNNAISINKIYNFWVLDVHNIGDIYFNHLDKLLRFSK